jgi:DNA-binding NarL/FixJ family response regulator
VPGRHARRVVPLPGGDERAGQELSRTAASGRTRARERTDAAGDDILRLIAEGTSAQETAEALTISLETEKRHRSILAKLGMRDRTELTRYVIRAGLIEP